MASDYGKKGGTSASAGKRGEVLRSPSTGMTRRVFKGQRWLVIAQADEAAPCDMLAFETEQKAKLLSDRLYGRCEVHYVERAEVLA